MSDSRFVEQAGPQPQWMDSLSADTGAPIRVLLLMTAREVGGAELYAQRLVETLAGQCAFTVALSDHPNMDALARQLERHTSVMRLSLGTARGLIGATWLLWQQARRHQIVHLNSNHPASRLGAWFCFALSLSRVPVVCVEQRVTSMQDVRVPAWARRLMPALFRLSRARVTHTIAVSTDNARALVDMYRLPSETIHVVHNSPGIATLEAEQAQRARAEIRAELGLTPDQWMILTLARLTANKGHRYLIEAAARVTQRCPGARFFFAGPEDERDQIERHIHQLGLERFVSILGYRADVARLLAASDLFVLPSLAEGFALSIVEALAAGLPVIATCVGGAPEIIRPGQNGFLVPPADARALAEHIVEVIEMPAEQRARLREAARETAARFSPQEMGKRTLAVYRSALAGASRRGDSI
ncbi:MAG: glycosyltransferase family 4 protein [Candidatus Roseilinea sp.]|uniref:glycosyltransferase family 4 protein n=1 Tax=Candidatus Roseilinea sp. TaxID=2838777 RepID=UPI004049E912